MEYIQNKSPEFSEPDEIFICWAGAERSRRVSRAFNTVGKVTNYFEGGTKKLKTLSVSEIKKLFSNMSMITLIYEQGSRKQEYDDYTATLDKLKQAGLNYQAKDMFALGVRLADLGVDINDYF